jgi:hypothetical protein
LARQAKTDRVAGLLFSGRLVYNRRNVLLSDRDGQFFPPLQLNMIDPKNGRP